MLDKTLRLRKGDFDLLLKDGRTLSCPLLSVRFARFPRKAVAVSVSKKVAPLAVDRNRGRRRVYAILRKNWGLIPSKTAIGFSLRKECLKASPTDLEQEIVSILKKIS